MNNHELMEAFPHGTEVEWGLLHQRTRVIGWDSPDVLLWVLGDDAMRANPDHLTIIADVKPLLVSDNQPPMTGTWTGDNMTEFIGERTVVFEHPTVLAKRDGKWETFVAEGPTSLPLVAGQYYNVYLPAKDKP